MNTKLLPQTITIRLVHYILPATMIVEHDGNEVKTAEIGDELEAAINAVTLALSSLGYHRNDKKTYVDMSLTVFHFETSHP